MMKRLITSACLMLCLHGYSFSDNIHTEYSDKNIPIVKQTPLGKYLSVHQAYKLLSDRSDIIFIDVRDAVEVGRMGHPDMVDAIVPIYIQTEQYDTELGEFILADNPSFLSEMQTVLTRHMKTRNDMIIITCGSGMRSAVATRTLAAQGYTNVWHIIDGYEGDDKRGLNTHNAWQLAGLPWSYDIIDGSQWRLLIKPEAE